MYDQDYNLKMPKKILNTITKNLPENFFPIPKIRQKSEIIPFSYDVNDHVDSKFK